MAPYSGKCDHCRKVHKHLIRLGFKDYAKTEHYVYVCEFCKEEANPKQIFTQWHNQTLGITPPKYKKS